jgi:hypothetical protein
MSGFLGVVASAPWLAGTPQTSAAQALSQTDAASGIRAALERGANAAVDLLGQKNGFSANPKVRIPLPGALAKGAKLMRGLGQGAKVDALEAAMNAAAEAAVPQARELLVQAARSVTAEDALKIVRGGDTSVTDFFVQRTREPLRVKFLPIVSRATERVDLASKYNAVAAKALSLGLVKERDANIQQYVTDKALDGMYRIIGEEERKIRADPVGTGSAILRKVFGF